MRALNGARRPAAEREAPTLYPCLCDGLCPIDHPEAYGGLTRYETALLNETYRCDRVTHWLAGQMSLFPEDRRD